MYREQLAPMRNVVSTYTLAVVATAWSVPRGMLTWGDFSSPDMFAPARMPYKLTLTDVKDATSVPVTPLLKITANTIAKLDGCSVV